MVSMSACIIPLGPDFQDPSGAQNYPPYIISATPDFDSIVSTLMFSVTITDPNVGDNLHVRWVADYPSTTQDYRTLIPDSVHEHSANGELLHATDQFNLDCVADNLAMTSTGQHRIEAIVADRPYLTDPVDGKLDDVESGGYVTRATWIVQVACTSSPQP
jgi:hypothetical protein